MKKLFILAFILICLIPLKDLFNPGLPVTHDGQDHVARIANFYQNLKEENIIPRWAGSLNWGYGHPILMFLYPLPSYFASLFHFLGFSLVDSLKIVFGISFILSGLAMFLWIKEFLGYREGVVAGFLYILAPYRFVDLYVRGAIGEHVAFIFPPLILFFLLRLSKSNSKKDIVLGSLSLAGLILSHNAISLMFVPLIVLYGFFLWMKHSFKRNFLYSFIIVFIFGFGISAFFWVPAFFEGKYTLRDKVTAGESLARFVPFRAFVYSPWNYGGTGLFSVQIGIVHWLMVFLGLLLSFINYKKKMIIFSLSAFLLFWIIIFLMVPLSMPVWKTITILQKFQFPWRFLSVAVFLTSLIGGLVVYLLNKKIKFVAACFVIFFLIILNKDYWHAKGYIYKPEDFYTKTYFGTTDTGESAPIWSVRFMEKPPKDTIEVIEGKADIKKLARKINSHSYQINSLDVSRIRENTLFFPGWKIYVDGRQTEIQFQDPKNRGLMTFFVEKGVHDVKVTFGETKLRIISDMISISSFIMIIVFFLISKNLWKQYR